MKRILLFNILICAFVWEGYAQTITVDPEVICKGENSYIATNPNLNYVHIGDIICVGNNSNHDTIIVRPEAWNMYSGSYTALSVVFYVDESGKHGWAVKAATYSKAKWNGAITASVAWNIEGINNYKATYDALVDMNGFKNDSLMRVQGNYSATNYPAAASIVSPFYFPAIGQLNYLFSQVGRLNSTFNVISIGSIPIDANWWSSTEFDGTTTTSRTNALSLNPTSGKIENKVRNLAAGLYVLPTMNF